MNELAELVPSTGELRVVGVFLLVFAAAVVYAYVEFLWHNRRRR